MRTRVVLAGWGSLLMSASSPPRVDGHERWIRSQTSCRGYSLGVSTVPPAIGISDHTPTEACGAVRSVLRGVRGRRGLQALAWQDRDGVRRPPVLPAHDEPPPAAPGRAL